VFGMVYYGRFGALLEHAIAANCAGWASISDTTT
jgi:hypothetical protein